MEQITDLLEQSPVIAAVSDQKSFRAALATDVAVLFHLRLNLLTAREDIAAAKAQHKTVLIHLDLAEGIGKDRTGIEWLAACGADGIISTRSHLVKTASECGLLTVQRFFALDSKGLDSIRDTISAFSPDLIEIMPGVIPKVIGRFATLGIPVIAGGLIETKAEVTAALGAGALAISTGRPELWSL